MFDVRIDARSNRLYITMSGFMKGAELAEAADAVIVAARQLRPGFDLINDIREFKVASDDALIHMKRAQAFMAQHGLRRAIRVVKNAVAELQLQRSSQEAGYKADTAESIEEAEKLLSG